MALALVSSPAFSMMLVMMAFFPSFLVTIKITSFSFARETPKNFSAFSAPVPLAWITVPPGAWAALAASITSSV